jgi:hypothetical protein
LKQGRDLPASWPILSIDFDGVLHSYTSGWHGGRKIVDPPIPGAIDWLRSLLPDQRDAFAPRHLDFDVQIFSSRARYWGGRLAMRRWLFHRGVTLGELEALKFPLWKPPSFLHIDDRALCFKGTFPTVGQMKAFAPWRMNTAVRNRFPAGAEAFIQPRDGPVVPRTAATEVVYAKNQPEYSPLRALVKLAQVPVMHVGETEIVDKPWKVLSRWEPTPEQREFIAQGGDIFLELMVQGQPLQPIRMFVGADEDADQVLEFLNED